MPKELNKVDARALVARLNQQAAGLQEREIIAPLLPGGKIRTHLGGMVHEFKPKGNFVGWGRFRPVNEREAEVLAEALPWQRAAYLELFPTLRVILLWPIESRLHGKDRRADKNTKSLALSPESSLVWWALPFNEGDARQRFGLNGVEPIPVYLCEALAGAQPFERVIARVDGKILWFDGPDVAADPTHAEWLRDEAAKQEAEPTEKFLAGLAGSERLALLFHHLHRLEQAERAGNRTAPTGQPEAMPRNQREQREWLRQQAGRNRLEQQLRYALKKADATLHSYSETLNPDGTPGQLVVEWSERGQNYRYRSVLDRGLTVVSGGICLSGRDRDFDLTSLVSVMSDRDDD